MKRAIYPGSFDPVTIGHKDLIIRSTKMFDEVIVAVLDNYRKQSAFSVEERVAMLELLTKDVPNVKVKSFSGLLVDFAKQENANVIVRGLRAVTDYEYELQMAQTNRQLNSEIDTVFLTASADCSYISSSAVRELALFGGDYSGFVPKEVVPYLQKRFDGLN
ncbi:MAG: pantetheine-phosphate adenylyltransferase [Lachnospiraceae bacterium]|nr:pantetheine-phosphate adenylyltransferase [Lachnospiraceae bacterium]